MQIKLLTEFTLIVVVFLRALEYYSGILFLTTNRVQQFDPAVLNRMILVIHFAPPGEKAKRKIIQNCLDRLKKQTQFEVTSDAKKAFMEIAVQDQLKNPSGAGEAGEDSNESREDNEDSTESRNDVYPVQWTGREIVSGMFSVTPSWLMLTSW